MSDIQLYLAIGVPIVFNAAMLLLLKSHVNSRFDNQDKLSRRDFAAWKRSSTRACA
jgi:hypothetical protein